MRLAFTILLLILLSSCEYSPEKLIIVNKTDSTICFETLIKNKKNSDYYQISAGGEILAHSKVNPVVREPISINIKNNSLDSLLYVIFYPCSDKNYVYSRINELGLTKRYLTKKYSLKQLEKLKWTIDFVEK